MLRASSPSSNQTLTEAHYRLFRAYRRAGEPRQAELALETYQKLQQQNQTDNIVISS